MIRGVGTALIGAAVLAALASCAYQDPFGLPELTPRGSSPAVQVYSSYGAGYGYGYGYPSGYRPGFGYGYADPYYAAQGPYPYAYGYGYNPYSQYVPYPRYVVVPCADNNRDGRCDSRLPRDHDHHGDGHDGDPDRNGQPQRQRDARGVVPRGGNGGSQGIEPPAVQPQAGPAPAPVVQQPARARPELRRALPSDAMSPRGTRGGNGRQSVTGDDVTLSRPTQEP